ncbi:GNAT family N-acetyltransferase [Zunongwangia endophytica]|uniref:GNAT family N-acetyltransferase n=1 Tax=Zunongwangia endophytica TaxID=1808945 RepID=A0ABV8HCS9_9FLAO|nr:GNAT family N-acetyltransferase [Zunongwangia endophytica]MDN3596777.1 GNAT family N-acetyltransferase [Zunongwangia endophytica]
MDLSFNRILKDQLDLIIPLIQDLAKDPIPAEVLKERFEQMLKQNYQCFGIFMDSKIIGVFGLWEMTRHYAGKIYEVDHIVIAEAHRGQGIGEKLFSFIDDLAKKNNAATVELNTYVENFKSHKFYMNQGYVIRGYHFQKKYY